MDRATPRNRHPSCRWRSGPQRHEGLQGTIYQVQGSGQLRQERMLIFRRLPRALQPDSEAYPVTGSSHETRQPHMACSSKSQECRLDDSAVECSKTKGKERFSPDQQGLTFAGEQPEWMKDERCRRAPWSCQTGRSMYSAACHDTTVSCCSQVLMPKKNTDAASGQPERSCPRDACTAVLQDQHQDQHVSI